ncbi:hypothetical protein [Alkalihalobacterium chitinilyticum]|uniref:DUF5067 domain-containing protein n=1 Tax=Alkalihalobacterium chitinilyticum TaxID=2980103 RepID=A0ABT5VB05_9BACI|nr:hypothetical protein [Alkalihalobacterium chitinilyticum]MDE5412653.1 hypothetical protein [Alkalihalobacterium chitinilyticum]
MHFLKLILLSLTLFVLASCGPQLEIQGDMEQSRIIMDEDRNLLTFYVRLENTSNLSSPNLFAKFELLNEELVEAFGQETLVFVNESQVPEAFKIGANSGFFIGESFEVEQTFAEEELTEAVEVVIFDEAGDDITRFTITNVELETN